MRYSRYPLLLSAASIPAGVHAAAPPQKVVVVGANTIIGDPGTYAGGDRAVAVGDDAEAFQTGDVAVGASATADGTPFDPRFNNGNAVAISGTAKGAGAVSIAGQATGDAAQAYGGIANGTNAISVGNAEAAGTQAVAMGSNALSSADYGVSVGNGTQTDASYASSFGVGTHSGGYGDLSMGAFTSTVATQGTQTDGNVALGTADFVDLYRNGVPADFDPNSVRYTQATGGYAMALGAGTYATGAKSDAIGYDATAAGASSVAVGTDSAATGTNSVAIGNGASAGADSSVALGDGSVATEANTVSVGNADQQRRIVNVAAGTAATDAVNMGQLANVSASVDAAQDNADTALATADQANAGVTSVTQSLGGGASYDPATGAYIAPSYTVAGQAYDTVGGALGAVDSQLSSLSGKVDGVMNLAYSIRREERRGIAAVAAMTTAPMPSEPGRTSWTANTAVFRGEVGFGGALAHRFDTAAPLALTAGFAYAPGGNSTARVGMAGEF